MTYIMKHIKVKISIVLLLGLGIIGIQAQDYKISFSGSVKSTNVDIVNVLNLTQGTELTLNMSETLHLVGTTTNIETQFSGGNDLLIYPNPSGETSNIKFYNSKAGQVIIEISDITGKLIIRRSQQLAEGSHTFSISGMSSGIYLVNVYTSDQSFFGKLLSNFKNSGNTSIEYLEGDFTAKPKYTLKSTQNLVQMQYNDGERILAKGISGNYSRVLTLIPTQDSTINFEFIECTDADSNHYSTITIGTQTWMAENLRTTHYADGTPIPLGTDYWPYYAYTNRDKAYCWFNNDSASNATTYGALYTWAAAMNGYPSLPGPYGVQGVCPTGWHLPSDEEWTTLTDYLGGIDVAGAKLMETDTMHWRSPNILATNESGFTALPGGRRPYGDQFIDIRDLGFWWSTKEDSCGRWFWCILSNDIIRMFSNCSKYQEGYSVRCLKGIPIGVLTTMPATNLSSTGATLNGSVPASNLSTTVTFEYGTSTSYGQEVTADQSPVTGDLITDVSATLTGLTRGTIYNYRVKTVNSLGSSYGGNMEFDVTQKPTLSTTSITDITSTTAISGGNITDDGGAPVTARGVFYSIYPITSTSCFEGSTRHTHDSLGSGSFTSKLTGLQPSTTYYVRSFAYNSTGLALGDMITFTTSTQAPTATTEPITNRSGTGATLNGIVNASNLSTKVTFEYGTTTSYGQEVTAYQSPVTGYTNTNVSAGLTGLMEGTYHFRVKAENSFWTVFGSDIEFTICNQFPMVTTLAATNISSTGAILNGTVNANGSSTIVTFEVGVRVGGKPRIIWRWKIPAKQSPVTGTTLTNVSTDITGLGLSPGTRHLFRVKAENSCGTVYGQQLSFTLH
jgi:uncharacterized protein (TIGR02145 family)